MSAAADRSSPVELPPEWKRLERAAEQALRALEQWKHRAVAAEEEVKALRNALEELVEGGGGQGGGTMDERRLRAENEALRSRMLEAGKVVASLMDRLSLLEKRS